MAEVSLQEAQGMRQQISGLASAVRAAYLVCAVLLATGVVLQVFLAGAALLVDGSYLDSHRAFAHAVEIVAMVTVIAGLFTRLPWRVQALGLLFLLLMFSQYIFLYAIPSLGIPSLRALHAVNALVMFWTALTLGQRTWQAIRGERVQLTPQIERA